MTIKFIACAVLALSTTLASTVSLADPIADSIKDEASFRKSIPWAAASEQRVINHLLETNASTQNWMDQSPLSVGVNKVIGTLTIVSHSGNCATVKSEMLVPKLGNWTYHGCKAGKDQFTLDDKKD